MKKGLLIGFVIGLITGTLLHGIYVPYGINPTLPAVLNIWTGTVKMVRPVREPARDKNDKNIQETLKEIREQSNN